MADTDGIDVAWPQGGRFNWKAQKNLSFGMCKVTEGLSDIDPDFAVNWDAMWFHRADHRLPRFAYHEFHADDDPQSQAGFMAGAISMHGLLPGDNLVVAIEPTGFGDRTPAYVAAAAAEFCHAANGAAPGHHVLVYANPATIAAGYCHGLGGWPLWIADYGVIHPMVPAVWSKWTFWQNSGTDLDTDQFNGTGAELLAFARMPGRAVTGMPGHIWNSPAARAPAPGQVAGVAIGAMPEDRGSESLQAYVLCYMRELCLWGYHPHQPEHDKRGWPDWVIIGTAGLLYRELKTEHGQLSPAQRNVGGMITRAGGNWAVWRPRDLVAGVIWRQLREIA